MVRQIGSSSLSSVWRIDSTLATAFLCATRSIGSWHKIIPYWVSSQRIFPISFSIRAGVAVLAFEKTSPSRITGHSSGPESFCSSAAASSSQSTVYLVAKVVSLCSSWSEISLSSSSIFLVAFLLASPSEATMSFRSRARFRHVERGMTAPPGSVAMPQSLLSLQVCRLPAATPWIVCSTIKTGRPAARLHTSLKQDSSRSLIASASRRQTSRIQLSMKALQAARAPSRSAIRCAICRMASRVLVWQILPSGSSEENCLTTSSGNCRGDATYSRSSARVSMRVSVSVFSCASLSGALTESEERKSLVRPATTIFRDSHSR
mmetsp:Transcript_14749/g.39107  ORF Transcript_14749/g.39107 Transcript_14749/m.39107 type:complete len:320 (-) Transcript_14749:1101-2060(-)